MIKGVRGKCKIIRSTSYTEASLSRLSEANILRKQLAEVNQRLVDTELRLKVMEQAVTEREHATNRNFELCNMFLDTFHHRCTSGSSTNTASNSGTRPPHKTYFNTPDLHDVQGFIRLFNLVVIIFRVQRHIIFYNIRGTLIYYFYVFLVFFFGSCSEISH